MKTAWFLKQREADKDIIEGTLRDLMETDGAPIEALESVLDYLFEIGFFKEE